MSKAEKYNLAFKLAFLSLKWAVTDIFSDYLMLNKFVVYTDNNPLTHVLTSAKFDETGQRWASALGEYNFDISYRAGHKNAEADGLSRFPHDLSTDDKICIKDQSVKVICANYE